MVASTPPKPPRAPHPQVPAAWRSRLWRRYAASVAVPILSCLVVFGVIELLGTFKAAREQLRGVHLAQSRELAQALHSSLGAVEHSLAAIDMLPWAIDGWLSPQVRREEYSRVLRLLPVIDSIEHVDAGGRRVVRVSRRQPDEWVAAAAPPGDGKTGAAAPASMWRHEPRVDYADDYDPQMVLELSFASTDAPGRTRVRVSLRALARELARALTPTEGEVYVVDQAGMIALHRSPLVMLERRRHADAPAGDAARVVRLDDGTATLAAMVGARQLRTVQPLDSPPWSVVVERPASTLMQPLRDTLLRLLGALALGTALSGAVAWWLASRLTAPIVALRDTVERIAGGDLAARAELHEGDELGNLARHFNRMAQSLQASYADLEQRVAEKTHDLRVANQHKSEFLAHMSHELRTPLNAVIGFSEALDDQIFGPLNPKQKEYVADIHASGQHLLALINDLLDLSKIEAGRLELELSEFSVADLLQAAASLLRERALHQGVALNVSAESAPATWRADARRVKQVVVNLLSNAVKFTPSGGHVQLAAGQDQEGLWVEVADDGLGIAPDEQARVFDEFYQGRGTGERKAEGTGLGLPLVKRLVDLHGGRVTLDSSAGAGTRVRFTIPRIGS